VQPFGLIFSDIVCAERNAVRHELQRAMTAIEQMNSGDEEQGGASRSIGHDMQYAFA
jgi:hypothetical protein